MPKVTFLSKTWYPSERLSYGRVSAVNLWQCNPPHSLSRGGCQLVGYFCRAALEQDGEDQGVKVRTAYSDETEVTTKNFTTLIRKGRVRCKEFPLVILTSNGERDFPPPFLRRCLRLNMKEPSQAELEKIVEAHLGQTIAEQAKVLIADFLKKRQQGDLATDQLLNAIYLVTRERAPSGQEKDKLIEQLLKYLTSTEDT